MDQTLLQNFADYLSTVSADDLRAEIASPHRLLLESATYRGKQFEIVYAPFDWINPDARLVVVGITPGRQQTENALLEAQRHLRAGASMDIAARAAKSFASFSGPMRTALVAMLDAVGVPRLMGIESTATLWTTDVDQIHFTSALRYPVFVNAENYTGTPSMVRTPLLRAYLDRWLVAEMKALPNAIFVPLGPKVAEALEHAGKQAGIDSARVLTGLPHPSGANAERIACFLGTKSPERASGKTNGFALLKARKTLEEKLRRIPAFATT